MHPYRYDAVFPPKTESPWVRLGFLMLIALPSVLIWTLIPLYHPKYLFEACALTEVGYVSIGCFVVAGIVSAGYSHACGHPSYYEKHPRLALLCAAWFPIALIVVACNGVYYAGSRVVCWIRYGSFEQGK